MSDADTQSDAARRTNGGPSGVRDRLVEIIGHGDITVAFDRLVWGIAHCAGPRGDMRLPRWACVRNATGMGSGVSSAICLLAGADPEELLNVHHAVAELLERVEEDE